MVEGTEGCPGGCGLTGLNTDTLRWVTSMVLWVWGLGGGYVLRTYLGHKAILMFTGLVQVLLQLQVALEEDFHSE